MYTAAAAAAQFRGELCSQVMTVCKSLGIANEVLCDGVLLLDRALSTDLEVSELK
jgi:hypothetical protein